MLEFAKNIQEAGIFILLATVVHVDKVLTEDCSDYHCNVKFAVEQFNSLLHIKH